MIDPGPEGVALHRAANGDADLVSAYWVADEGQRARLRERYRQAGKTPRLEHPLGAIRERRLITEAEYLAGISYSEAHQAIERQRREKSCLASVHRSGGGSVRMIGDPEAEAKHEARYVAAREALQSAGKRAFLQVQAVVLYGHAPDYLFTHRTRVRGERRNDAREHMALRRGLQALLTVYKHREGPDDVEPIAAL